MLIVKSARDTGTITYYCTSPRSALEKFEDFEHASYRDINIYDSSDLVISKDTLLALVAGDRAELSPH